MVDPPPDFASRVAGLGAPLEPMALARIAAYLDLLLAGNERMNLVRVEDADQAWERHALDSLSLLPAVDRARKDGDARIVDLGSGGGLPGLVLALARPSRLFTLVETTLKKAVFLEEIAAKLGAGNVRVLPKRAEDLGRDRVHRERYPLVVARAVSKLPVLLELGLPLVEVGGELVAMKGTKAEAEVEESALALARLGGAARIEALDSLFPGRDARLVIVAKTKKTPPAYPRPAGIPERKPIG